MGLWTTNDEIYDTGIRTRLAMAYFIKRRKRKEKKLTINMRQSVKKKDVKAMVCSTILHVSKTWPIKADTIHEIEDFAMWGLKRTENISWTEKTNEKVLAMVGEKRRLMEKMIKTKKEMD